MKLPQNQFSPALPFKITTLLFVRDHKDRFLMIRRKNAPNKNKWSPPGGKLEMDRGESPFECAIREAGEETGMKLSPGDLHLWGMLSEKHFEGNAHWLMFQFRVIPRIESLPPTLDHEGHFQFFPRNEIDTLDIPATDHQLVWPYFDKYHRGFVAYRVDCSQSGKMEIEVDQILD